MSLLCTIINLFICNDCWMIPKQVSTGCLNLVPLENLYVREYVVVNGCFHHSQCRRILSSGTPFPAFACVECFHIYLEDDFRKRVFLESLAMDKKRHSLCNPR